MCLGHFIEILISDRAPHESGMCSFLERDTGSILNATTRTFRENETLFELKKAGVICRKPN